MKTLVQANYSSSIGQSRFSDSSSSHSRRPSSQYTSNFASSSIYKAWPAEDDDRHDSKADTPTDLPAQSPQKGKQRATPDSETHTVDEEYLPLNSQDIADKTLDYVRYLTACTQGCSTPEEQRERVIEVLKVEGYDKDTVQFGELYAAYMFHHPKNLLNDPERDEFREWKQRQSLKFSKRVHDDDVEELFEVAPRQRELFRMQNWAWPSARTKADWPVEIGPRDEEIQQEIPPPGRFTWDQLRKGQHFELVKADIGPPSKKSKSLSKRFAKIQSAFPTVNKRAKAVNQRIDEALSVFDPYTKKWNRTTDTAFAIFDFHARRADRMKARGRFGRIDGKHHSVVRSSSTEPEDDE